MAGHHRAHSSLSSDISPTSAGNRSGDFITQVPGGDVPPMPSLTPPTVGGLQCPTPTQTPPAAGGLPRPLPTQTPPPIGISRSASSAGAYRRERPLSRSIPYQTGYSNEFDGPMSARSLRSTRSQRSTRPLRSDDRDDWDDEDYYYERDRDAWRSRDMDRFPGRQRSMREGTRPPQAWRNRSLWDGSDSSISLSKPYFVDETASQRELRIRDEEMGYVPTWSSLSREQKVEVLRLPLTHWMNSELKNHFVASTGEFIGTSLFLFFAFAGTEVANLGSQASDSNFDIARLLYISICFGFSLMVNVWIFFRISGGLFNPAVTLAMMLVKAIPPVRAGCLFVAQILGALLASVIVRFLFPGSFSVRTSLSDGVSLVQGVFIEAILTAELVFTIFMLAKEKHRATFIAPVGIGLALFIAELVGVAFTGGSLNPARSFGPCAVTGQYEAEHWIYWIGPILGALIAVVFYRFIKTLEYEMANPGADGDVANDPTINPEKRAEIQSHRKRSMSVASHYQ
ncbi:hypothetical protein PFICI_09092 [Pestalotiopsis fici W106-1]|uniref:Aquaporin-1 n=1 Tax=Pestalotiopsis fici (strain W106-1 / CGMCC3.15140) TaxID=1229662 RepID=W3WZQ2_PESFW|nr:uncharacterized protein PFICI_09092 [Pestalotiopsis fici W106-1]ETS79239.1 hypothetical protein PFICI_09092 [Pestalotiopsis fici W106-1]